MSAAAAGENLMSKRTGGGFTYDINWLADGHVFKPVGVKANVQVTEICGSGGAARLQSLELTLSARIWNTTTPCDTNILYCGDVSLRSSLPFPIVSNAPNGRKADGTWLTDTLIFKPMDVDNAFLPLTPSQDGTRFECSFPIIFGLMVMGLCDHLPEITGTGKKTTDPHLCDQTAIMRGWWSDGQENPGSMHATQTKLLIP